MTQTSGVSPTQRWSRSRQCPVCGGNNTEHPHCHGFEADGFVYCTSAQHANGAKFNENCAPPAYLHKRNDDGGYRPWTAEPPPINAARRRMPPPSKTHTTAPGTQHFYYTSSQRIRRIDELGKDKVIRPEHLFNGMWHTGDGEGDIEFIYHRKESAAQPDAPLLIVEGETCCDLADSLGLRAITWRGGAGRVSKALDALREVCNGQQVVLWPDADTPGRKAMEQIAAAIAPDAASVQVLDLFPDEMPDSGGKDIEDWLAEGGDFDTLMTMIAAAPVYHATAPLASVEGMSLKVLMQQQFIPRQEFVPGIIVQGVSLLASKAKIGKTWLTLNIGLALAYGGMALGKIEVEKTGVLILSLEDGQQRLQDRFALLLNDETPPDGLTIFTEWPRLDAGGGTQLDAYLAANPDVKVIFIDTLVKIRPARRKGGDLYSEDYHIGEVLKEIAEKHGVAIVVVYHTRKARADDPLDEIRDTMGLTGGVDNCLVLRRVRGQADAELFVSGRDIAEEKGYVLTWDTTTAQWIIAGDASEYAVSTARRQVLDALASPPNGLTPTEAARLIGKPLSAVKKLMWTMSKEGVLIVTAGRYTKHSNPGNPVTVKKQTLTEQGKTDTSTVTSGLPDAARSNSIGNRDDAGNGTYSGGNGVPGYPVTGVTAINVGQEQHSTEDGTAAQEPLEVLDQSQPFSPKHEEQLRPRMSILGSGTLTAGVEQGQPGAVAANVMQTAQSSSLTHACRKLAEYRAKYPADPRMEQVFVAWLGRDGFSQEEIEAALRSESAADTEQAAGD